MPTAYSYIRFSTPEQRHGDSLRRQLKASEDYAATRGLTLDKSLYFRDLGLSAFNGSNVHKGALGAFINAVDTGRIESGSFLLVESLDRLSRDKISEALTLFISLLSKGIKIVTLMDGKTYDEESLNNMSDLIVSIALMSRAHEESATKSKRIRASWINKRNNLDNKILTKRCPLWLRVNSEGSGFEFIPERLAVVKEIIRMTNTGFGQAVIAKTLNEKNVPTFTSYSKGWHNSYIYKILSSPYLFGQFQPCTHDTGSPVPSGDPIDNYYPAVVSKEEFMAMQALRSGRLKNGGRARKGKEISNLFSGTLKCGYCGGSMVLCGSTAKRVKSVDGAVLKRPSAKYLVCDNGRRGRGCYAVQWNYKDFETTVLSFCAGLELDRILSGVTGSANEMSVRTVFGKIEEVTAKIDGKKVQLSNLVSAVESGNPPAILISRMTELESEIADLMLQKRTLSEEFNRENAFVLQSADSGQKIRDLVTQLNELEDDELFLVRSTLADHIRRFIDNISIHPAGRLFSKEKVEQIKEGLKKSGYKKMEVEKYISENHPITPRRQGRGEKGRYLARQEVGRFITILSKTGGLRHLYPNFNDPSHVRIDYETSITTIAEAA